MLVFFTNFYILFMEFQVRYLTFLFSVLDSFKWFWMESLNKNIQSMLELHKALFLVLHFSYYIYINDLPDDVIYGNNWNCLLNLNLIYDTLSLGTGARSELLISMLGKLNWIHLTGLITLVLLM